ncbi:MAG: putative transporter ATP-binding protein [Paenibacillus sp.]|uniref:ABC transporter ATP-binding protein n=1 Tax=Paenibacillus sp. GCM10012303 TaxID=3317340 RepID=UPI0029ECAC8F|nr:putative transporter ATP-binding protein [Paenibacillus sp.]
MEQLEAVRVVDVCKSFAHTKSTSDQVLHRVSFGVGKGEIVSLLGQSGCGKSTLLSIIGGFDKQDSGTVWFGGEEVSRPNRKCVMMFQNYGLLPWRSVLKNVELGLEETELTAVERKAKALDYLRLVGLEDKAGLFPRQLSGGMQQRVALARALAIEPELILMDEPFAALDTFTRYHLQNELLRIQSQSGTTIILVTHDIDEAVYLSDRILIMNANPGGIHKEIHVHTARPRDRGHGEFQLFRKQILEFFHFNGSAQPEEYTI